MFLEIFLSAEKKEHHEKAIPGQGLSYAIAVG